MRGLVRIISLMFIFFFSVLAGCVVDVEDKKTYSVLVVQSGDDKTDEIVTDAINVSSGKFHEVEFLTSLDVAQKQYPQADIEHVPAVLIFETGGAEIPDYKTYDIKEAVAEIKEL